MHTILQYLSKENILFLVAMVIMILLFPQEILASEAEGGLPYESWIKDLRTSMTGTVALTFALLGIVGAGGALIFMGAELNGFIRMILFLVLVISIIIGANDLLDGYSGGGSEIAMTYDKEEETLLAMAQLKLAG